MQSNMRKINDPTEKLAILFGLFVFLVLSFVDRVPDELWNEVHDIVQETKIKTIPMEKKCKKAKWLSWEALQIAVKRRSSEKQRR